jgi:hypothetical protein
MACQKICISDTPLSTVTFTNTKINFPFYVNTVYVSSVVLSGDWRLVMNCRVKLRFVDTYNWYLPFHTQFRYCTSFGIFQCIFQERCFMLKQIITYCHIVLTVKFLVVRLYFISPLLAHIHRKLQQSQAAVYLHYEMRVGGSVKTQLS